MNSVDISEESHSVELLSSVISLRVTIPGFSIASTWMHGRIQAAKTTKAKHSLKKA